LVLSFALEAASSFVRGKTVEVMQLSAAGWERENSREFTAKY
jgi:hypothetical protein